MKKQTISIEGWAEDAIVYMVTELIEQGFDVEASGKCIYASRDFAEEYAGPEEPATVH